MYNAKPDSFEEIAKDILAALGRLLATRPYIAITDSNGTIRFIDPPLELYAKFIQNFVYNNFNLLGVGDHSLPLGGVNLAFFKLSPIALVVLYTMKGVTGQLLSFKAKMFEWSGRIDQLISGVVTTIPAPQAQTASSEPLAYPTSTAYPPSTQYPPSPAYPASTPEAASPTYAPSPASTAPSSTSASELAAPSTKAGLKSVPFLIKKLTGKEKFPLEEAQILQFCDGTNSIEDICAKTGYARLKVDEVIRDYQKKKWIELKRIVL